MDRENFDAVVISGPTASGKSALALALAERMRCEIISLDSALVYRGMDIGTAKPSREERARVPHHLIDIRDPDESYSAAAFAGDCNRLIGEIRARGALPVICGGTMLYYKALIDGLSPLPATDPLVRAEIAARAQALGWPALHARLAALDPAYAARISPLDRQRIARALEVHAMCGRTMSDLQQEHGEGSRWHFLEFMLLPPHDDRTALYQVIRERFAAMLKTGFADEVRDLMTRYEFSAGMPAARAVGYRQMLSYLRQEIDYDTMVEQAVIATCHLAKHQTTWLRGALSRGSGARVRLDIGAPDLPDRVWAILAEHSWDPSRD